ncbi:MAG: malto-oligosyltrehalose trehalohydrolase [Verrucomicrobia bacterium]|nr:malto-oligosyltrehalose trehalohydrolase [Verrucomicrobiota bacterium]
MKNRLVDQGAELVERGVSFRTFSTGKNAVSLAILNESGQIIRETLLESEPSGYYSLIDPAAHAGTLYKYRLDQMLTPDPASRYQPQGVHGPSQVIDPRGFHWSDQDWRRPRLDELVLYELHVGTFSKEGTFEAVAAKFDHMKSVGITAIELMPIGDFAGDRNWGYDGVSIYAPAHVYGRPHDLRLFVNAAHRAGLAVILDVVYNHFGPDGNYTHSFSGAYLNKSKDTPWGPAFNLDGPNSTAVRKFFSQNPIYWMTEFHIDGFRLDATHAIPDDSPTHLIAEIAEAVQAKGGLVICEDPRNDRNIVMPREQGGYGCDAVWADDFHHVVRVQMTGENEGYLGYFKGTMEELIKTLREGWLYTGELQKDGIPRGTKGQDIEPEHFVHCISNHDQVGNRAFGDRLSQIISPASYRAASALLLIGPYTPMLFMGQEWATSAPFLYFTDHHDELGKGVTEGRRREFSAFAEFQDPITRERIPDPQALSTFETSKLRWYEASEFPNAGVLRLYQHFLRFRRRRIGDRRRGRWTVSQISPTAIAIRYKRSPHDDLLILAQLVSSETQTEEREEILRPAEGFTWRFVMSTNEPVYGGDFPGLYDPESRKFILTEPELIVFAEQPAAER